MERWLANERNVRACAVLGAVAIAFSSIVVRLSHASVQPVGSVALAALIFAESPSVLQLLGVTVVMAALVTATRPRRRKATARRAGLAEAAQLESST